MSDYDIYETSQLERESDALQRIQARAEKAEAEVARLGIIVNEAGELSTGWKHGEEGFRLLRINSLLSGHVEPDSESELRDLRFEILALKQALDEANGENATLKAAVSDLGARNEGWRVKTADLQAEYNASCRRACNYLLEIQRLTYEMEAK